MGGKRFRTGSILVLFSVAVLCLAIFGALTVSTAKSGEKTAARFAEHVQSQTQCENLGQAWLAQAEAYRRGEAALPENTTREEDILETQITVGRVALTVRVALEEAQCRILTWNCVTNWQADTSWDLWGGA